MTTVDDMARPLGLATLARRTLGQTAGNTAWWTPSTLCRLVLEARPKVLAIGMARFAAGALLSGGVVLSMSVGLGLTSWLLVTFAIYVLNGVSDLAADRLNGSTRPLASGVLPVPVARHAVLVAATLGLAIGATVSLTLLAHLGLALALGVGYSVGPRPAKSSSGKAFGVVTLGGLVTYHAGLVAAGGEITLPFIAFALCLSLWMGIGSLLKDLTDIAGDRAAGRRTLAVIRGPSTTTAVATAGAAGIAVVLVWSARHSQVLAVPAVILVLGVIALAVARTKVQWRNAGPYRLFTYVQFASHGALLHFV